MQDEGVSKPVVKQGSSATTDPRPADINWWQRISAVGEFVGGAGTIILVIGLLIQIDFAEKEFRDYKFQRRTERMDNLYAQFNTPTMSYYRAAASSKPGVGSPYAVEVLSFFERMAREHQHEVITTDDVWYYFGEPLLIYWCGWQDWVRENRKASADETGDLWSGIQRLAETVKSEKKEKCFQQQELLFRLEMEVMRHVELTENSKVESHVNLQPNSR